MMNQSEHIKSLAQMCLNLIKKLRKQNSTIRITNNHLKALQKSIKNKDKTIRKLSSVCLLLIPMKEANLLKQAEELGFIPKKNNGRLYFAFSLDKELSFLPKKIVCDLLGHSSVYLGKKVYFKSNEEQTHEEDSPESWGEYTNLKVGEIKKIVENRKFEELPDPLEHVIFRIAMDNQIESSVSDGSDEEAIEVYSKFRIEKKKMAEQLKHKRVRPKKNLRKEILNWEKTSEHERRTSKASPTQKKIIRSGNFIEKEIQERDEEEGTEKKAKTRNFRIRRSGGKKISRKESRKKSRVKTKKRFRSFDFKKSRVELNNSPVRRRTIKKKSVIYSKTPPPREVYRGFNERRKTRVKTREIRHQRKKSTIKSGVFISRKRKTKKTGQTTLKDSLPINNLETNDDLTKAFFRTDRQILLDSLKETKSRSKKQMKEFRKRVAKKGKKTFYSKNNEEANFQPPVQYDKISKKKKRELSLRRSIFISKGRGAINFYN